MLTKARVWIACAALCSGVLPVLGAEVYYPSAHRQVAIWRGEGVPEPPEAPRMARNGKQEPLDIPPLPDDEPNSPSPDPVALEPSATASSCTSCGGSGCSDCGGCSPFEACCTPFWAHRSSVWGEILYFRATGNNIAYGFQETQPSGAPIGRVGVVGGEFSSAFRVGFNLAFDTQTSLTVAYTDYMSHATDSLADAGFAGDVVHSLVMNPNWSVDGVHSSFLQASHDVDFRTVDLGYRRMFAAGCNYGANYNVGVRYGKLVQDFQQLGTFGTAENVVRTDTAITFEGGGFRAGLDCERQVRMSNFSVYGKSFINVLFGQFNSSLEQVNFNAQSLEVANQWRDERVVPVLEYEAGLNWNSPSGAWRTSIGYYGAFWFNAVTTGQYIDAVNNSSFTNLGETVAFSGLVTRLEYRY